MITADKFKGKKVAVFGLGKSGQSAARALAAGGVEVYASDDNDKQINSLRGKLSVNFASPDEFPWKEISSLILSPGVPLTHPKPHAVVGLAKAHGVEIIGDVEMLYRQCPQAKFVGITGTNGKSTTTALIGYILKCAGKTIQVGGNLGTPVLDFMNLGNDGIYVIEMSSYQLELLTSCRFGVALLLNITSDHIDRHGDMIGYVSAKKKIFDRQQAGDCAAVGLDDVGSVGIYEYLRNEINGRSVIGVSCNKQIAGGVFAHDGVIYDSINRNSTGEYDISSIDSLRGTHNWQNACFAVAAARALGLDGDAIFKGLSTFPGLAHRMEKVAEIGGVLFVNDSKATNADAAAKALASYNDIFWIAGGKPKEGGISGLSGFFPRIKKAYLIGEAEKEFASTLEGAIAYEKCSDLKRAFEVAAKDALAAGIKGSTVLLSPACASFDQWPNFEARGDAFRRMAVELSDDSRTRGRDKER